MAQQRTLGLIGGLSWESSKSYYQWLNEGVKDRLGGFHSADLIMHSLDFAAIEEMQRANDWDAATLTMINAAEGLERAGAKGLIICSNTMHKCAKAVQAMVDIPLLHVADSVGLVMMREGYKAPLLLGTKFTMEEDFYHARLEQEFGFKASTPDDDDRQTVHDIIYDELCQGIISDGSRASYQQIIDKAAKSGSDCVILGCTEIGLLIQQSDVDLPVLDTTAYHVKTALDFMLSEFKGET